MYQTEIACRLRHALQFSLHFREIGAARTGSAPNGPPNLNLKARASPVGATHFLKKNEEPFSRRLRKAARRMPDLASLQPQKTYLISGQPSRPASGRGPFPRLGSVSSASARLGSGLAKQEGDRRFPGQLRRLLPVFFDPSHVSGSALLSTSTWKALLKTPGTAEPALLCPAHVLSAVTQAETTIRLVALARRQPHPDRPTAAGRRMPVFWYESFAGLRVRAPQTGSERERAVTSWLGRRSPWRTIVVRGIGAPRPVIGWYHKFRLGTGVQVREAEAR